ncbi:glycosyltransferase family 2 protein [Vibrio nomapromontoriensis]|uniref:glycosyltransferase family 2 protein n=1 Tax=Vibrio nomapromontoriensis TaxID=2910246 RepID=UPI003D0ACE75
MNSLTNKPLVSIIINCFNSATYLRETIESVLSQSYENFELIFWDNQSTDASADIVKSYDDDRIKYFYAAAHTSLGEGRNLALAKTRGEFVSFLDADDAYSPNRLEVCVNAFTDNTIGLVYTNGEIENSGKRSLFYNDIQQSGSVFKLWLQSYKVMIPSVMFRRECLSTLGHWVDTRFSMVEEYDFFLRIAKQWQIAYCHENVCIWREHAGSMTWSKTGRWGQEFALLSSKMFDEGLATVEQLQTLDKKSAYYLYLGGLKEHMLKRAVLKPYILKDTRVFILYISSFLGIQCNLFLLKFAGLIK